MRSFPTRPCPLRPVLSPSICTRSWFRNGSPIYEKYLWQLTMSSWSLNQIDIGMRFGCAEPDAVQSRMVGTVYSAAAVKNSSMASLRRCEMARRQMTRIEAALVFWSLIAFPKASCRTALLVEFHFKHGQAIYAPIHPLSDPATIAAVHQYRKQGSRASQSSKRWR